MPAFTVPGTQTYRGGKPAHIGGAALTWETVDIRRAIPEAKLAAVKTALDAHGPRWSIDYGGPTLVPPMTQFRDGRGWRQRFAASKTDAQMTTYLAAIETAITT